MTIRIENRFLEYDENSISLFEFAIVNIAEEVFHEHFEVWACKDDHQYLVILITMRTPQSAAASGRKALELLIPQLQHYVTLYLQGKVSVISSDFGVFPNDLSELYQKTRVQLRRLPVSIQEYFIRLWDRPPQTPIRSLQRLYEPPTILQLMETGRWQDAHEKLDYIFAELSQEGLDSADNLSEVYFALSNAFTYVVHMNGLQLSEVMDDRYDANGPMHTFRSANQLHRWSLHILQRIKEFSQSGRKESHSSFILQIHQYIERHLSDDVSLQAISDHIRLHPTYLSAMYKQETGENLSEYIYRYRMEKAAYLLRHSKAKIYEIAAQLGYQYTPYFTKLFKSYFGASPQEYRGITARE